MKRIRTERDKVILEISKDELEVMIKTFILPLTRREVRVFNDLLEANALIDEIIEMESYIKKTKKI